MSALAVLLVLASLLALSFSWNFFWNVGSFPSAPGQHSTIFLQSVNGYFYCGYFKHEASVKMSFTPDVESVKDEEAPQPGFTRQRQEMGFGRALVRFDSHNAFSGFLAVHYGLCLVVVALCWLGLVIFEHGDFRRSTSAP